MWGKEVNGRDENVCMSVLWTACSLYVKILSAHILKYFFQTGDVLWRGKFPLEIDITTIRLLQNALWRAAKEYKQAALVPFLNNPF